MRAPDRTLVRETNRRFYEAIAPVYEKVDQRRSGARDHGWLKEILRSLARPDAILLDLGAGTAFLSKLALPYFDRVIAADLSPAVLQLIEEPGIEKLCAACEEVPLESGSVDVVAAFATLHHLYDPRETFREAHRLLKSGGKLYTDHDIERSFVGNFRWPLRIYRHFFDHGHKYLAASPELSEQDYALTEFHGENGLSGPALEKALKEIGFREVEITYHWHGLLPFTPPWKVKGLSPLLRIIATK